MRALYSIINNLNNFTIIAAILSTMATTHHDHQHHHHEPHHGENPENFDPGAMYSQEWVQDGINKIQSFIRTNVLWLGIDASAKQRVLDYACGHGTISIALASECPHAIFRGLDIHSKQVVRYNDEATKLFAEDHSKMYAIQADLCKPSSDLDSADWSNFDVAIISMALHHVFEPVGMLSQLRKRLRTGGTLVVVEMYEDGDQENVTKSDNLNPEGMIVVNDAEKIWAGFSPHGLIDLLGKAGFANTNFQTPDLSFRMPDNIGELSGRKKKLMFCEGCQRCRKRIVEEENRQLG